MIEAIKIENYKSIEALELPLGRVTVLIGENGAGKSNILEAIALLGAARDNKLDNEFLVSRGIRTVDPIHTYSAFNSVQHKPKRNSIEVISISYRHRQHWHSEFLTNKNEPYSKWYRSSKGKYFNREEEEENIFMLRVQDWLTSEPEWLTQMAGNAQITVAEAYKQGDFGYLRYLNYVQNSQENVEVSRASLDRFLIYSPENSALRILEQEGQIQPLGINGQGLLKLLSVLHLMKQTEKLDEIKEMLRLLCWFEDFESDVNMRENRLEIRDKFLDIDFRTFDQRSANEGFLFVLFYAALMVADETPKFFAIDNVDASLNPKLCTELVRQIVRLAKKYDKQVILTTHNPAILDGLNLDDDEQRLFVVSRNKSGRTRVRRIHKPRPIGDEQPVKLSRAFLSGMLGGLPKGF